MIDNNPVLEALADRRSIRKYTDSPISREDLTAILEAGRWAPSGLNNQPWRFLVIHKDDPRAAKVAQCTKYSKIAQAAKVLICVFLERECIYNEMKDHQAVGACLQNMMLAAHSLNIGTVWLGEILNQEAQVLEILNLPLEKYELQAVVAAGHPAQKGGSSRKDLSKIMLETY
ncbi:nitroreductase [Maridesulfovibrio ferrireducens]|uniref:nitroreductase family protein n=1 Tax=Maridesulfovibrio ferrireducens TaxID=246191 RepID=UPI001A34C57F|nr:nitroreductase [Maridesulfovibrio ferrireducens]MBI9109865.1 nitroreductase [Maridesulfovibrio ferrireducens]